VFKKASPKRKKVRAHTLSPKRQATPIPKALAGAHFAGLQDGASSECGEHLMDLGQNLSEIYENEHNHLCISIRKHHL